MYALKSEKINGHIDPGRPTSNAKMHFTLRSGRERFQIKRWWKTGGNKKNYIDCSAATLVGEDGCEFMLVWPHCYDTRLDVEWSLKFSTLNFRKFRKATRAALLCPETRTVLSHYVFGKVPGVGVREYKMIDPWVCPNECIPGTGLRCFKIFELPTLGTSEPLAPKSVDIFDVCVDVPRLPELV